MSSSSLSLSIRLSALLVRIVCPTDCSLAQRSLNAICVAFASHSHPAAHSPQFSGILTYDLSLLSGIFYSFLFVCFVCFFIAAYFQSSLLRIAALAVAHIVVAVAISICNLEKLWREHTTKNHEYSGIIFAATIVKKW